MLCTDTWDSVLKDTQEDEFMYKWILSNKLRFNYMSCYEYMPLLRYSKIYLELFKHSPDIKIDTFLITLSEKINDRRANLVLSYGIITQCFIVSSDKTSISLNYNDEDENNEDDDELSLY